MDVGSVTPVEVACDESGSEGDNLVGGNTDVFAHASVLVDRAEAEGCVRELRDRIRSPAVEYKANHLLRAKSRPALLWLLGPHGPLLGNARVYLAEKPFVAVERLLGVVLGEPAGDHARILYQAGPEVFGAADWQAFLRGTNERLRSRNGASATPGFDPLIDALARTVAYWAGHGRPLAIVHDEQSAITPARIEALHTMTPNLVGVRLVNSQDDARVQLADFLAGVARRIAEDERRGDGDPQLTALVRPYIDAGSAWGDSRSWAALCPGNR